MTRSLCRPFLGRPFLGRPFLGRPFLGRPFLGRPFLAVLLALTGCASEIDKPVDPWVAVGHGLERYEPLADGDPVELVLGPQGGWHVDLAARFASPALDRTWLVFRVWDPDHEHQIGYPIKTPVNQELVTATPDGAFERHGARVVLAIGEPAEVVGHELLAEVELIAGSHAITDARVMQIVDELP